MIKQTIFTFKMKHNRVLKWKLEKRILLLSFVFGFYFFVRFALVNVVGNSLIGLFEFVLISCPFSILNKSLKFRLACPDNILVIEYIRIWFLIKWFNKVWLIHWKVFHFHWWIYWRFDILEGLFRDHVDHKNYETIQK